MPCTALVAFDKVFLPLAVRPTVTARASSGCRARFTSSFSSNARTTCEVVMGSIPASSATSYCFTRPPPPIQSIVASTTACACVRPHGCNAPRTARCHALLTRHSVNPGLSAGRFSSCAAFVTSPSRVGIALIVSGRIHLGHPENDDGEDQRERAHQVHRRGEQGNPVVVRIQPQAKC